MSVKSGNTRFLSLAKSILIDSQGLFLISSKRVPKNYTHLLHDSFTVLNEIWFRAQGVHNDSASLSAAKI